MRLILLIGGAGFVGAVARYLIGGWVHRVLPPGFPYGTLCVNVIGSFLLGAVFALSTERAALDPELRLVLGVGFLGAFTTFSTFSLETVNLLREGSLMLAAGNVGANVLLCLMAAWVGIGATRLL